MAEILLKDTVLVEVHFAFHHAGIFPGHCDLVHVLCRTATRTIAHLIPTALSQQPLFICDKLGHFHVTETHQPKSPSSLRVSSIPISTR